MTDLIPAHWLRKRGKQSWKNFRANFLGSRPDASGIIVTDTRDGLIVNTVGNFIDKCPDEVLLEKIKERLVPIQTGEAEAQPFFCPRLHKVEQYCKQRNIWLKW